MVAEAACVCYEVYFMFDSFYSVGAGNAGPFQTIWLVNVIMLW
jgi:hypothetical protein